MPILCAGAGYGVVKLQNSRRRRLKIQQEHLKNAEQKGKNMFDNIGTEKKIIKNPYVTLVLYL